MFSLLLYTAIQSFIITIYSIIPELNVYYLLRVIQTVNKDMKTGCLKPSVIKAHHINHEAKAGVKCVLVTIFSRTDAWLKTTRAKQPGQVYSS